MSSSESELLLVTRPSDNHSPRPAVREVPNSLCEVFLKEVFGISQWCEIPSYKYYSIMIKQSFSPKMCCTKFENRFTIKI